MKLIRLFLFPFTPIYAFVTWLRNTMYDKNFLKSTSFSFPIVAIGNLSTGGTGKTPMTEYIIDLFKDSYNIAVLSRGYKRKTKGFILANSNSTFMDLGDEPYQMHLKFKKVDFAVDANRVRGVNLLKEKNNNIDVVLLDDAFQHRAVKAGFYILLTPFDDLFIDDFLLPTGNLREMKSGVNRADIIIVSKTPKNTSEKVKEAVRKRLEHYNKPVFFSEIIYSEALFNHKESITLDSLQGKKVTLVTGIANPKPLKDFLNTKGIIYDEIEFEDHHDFSASEISQLENIDSFIITTEKDYVRMHGRVNHHRLFYLPIKTKIYNSVKFEELILKFIKEF